MEFLASMYCLEAGSSLWPMVLSHDSLIDIWSTHMPLPFLEREHVSVCRSTSSSAVAHCKRKNDKSRTRSWILLCVKLKWISVSADVSSHPSCFLNAFNEQHRWAFFTTPPFCSDLSQLINRGPFYLLGKQVVMIVSQCTYDEKVSASMCFLFGMLHLLTHTQVWEGRSRYFWLRLRRCSKHHHPRLLSCFGSFHSKGHVPL